MSLKTFNDETFKANGICVELDGELNKYTTFQLGGAAQAIVHCQSPEQVVFSVKELQRQDLPFILIGGGSNLVVSDHGLECIVIRFCVEKPQIKIDNNQGEVSAGTVLDDLVVACAKAGKAGLNYCSGIPGTVGGAIVGNAGAFGKQVGDFLIDIDLITQAGELKTLDASELDFSYRDSKLKRTSDIVLKARFQLSASSQEILQAERKEILKVRWEKHPDLKKQPCAGSFFRNIEPTSKAGRRQATGYFLEQAGGKNLIVGGARIFDRHANIIVKSADCKAQDVYDLSEQMRNLAAEKCNLDLVREVRFVGKFNENKPDPASLIW